MDHSVCRKMRVAISDRGLAGAETPVLLMVSGGSDSTALAYLCADLRDAGLLGPLAMLHVNHKLRGADADGDARFAAELALLLDIPLFSCEIDVAGMAKREQGNVEAVARRERYLAANEALSSLCFHEGFPLADGRIFTAHTADDRIETFYMRSIVGTGPGGFRSMLYRNGPVCRPLLDVERDELRDYLGRRETDGLPVVRDGETGGLWREDATNAHTDRFRAFVRHRMVPAAKERNPQLAETLTRTMNLIADEDDMLEAMAADLERRFVLWLSDEASSRSAGDAQDAIGGCGDGADRGPDEGCGGPDASEGFLLLPRLGAQPVPLQRRVVDRLLQQVLGPDARVESASVQAVLDGWSPTAEGEKREAGEAAAGKDELPAVMNSGYVANIQGDLAVSANKRGVRVEPMAAFRARRKRG